MRKVKIRIISGGGYPFKPGNNRTFPVIVNGTHEEGEYFVSVNSADGLAIGMYCPGFDPSFCIEGHQGGASAEIVE